MHEVKPTAQVCVVGLGLGHHLIELIGQNVSGFVVEPSSLLQENFFSQLNSNQAVMVKKRFKFITAMSKADVKEIWNSHSSIISYTPSWNGRTAEMNEFKLTVLGLNLLGREWLSEFLANDLEQGEQALKLRTNSLNWDAELAQVDIFQSAKRLLAPLRSKP
jgi:hypothetical protein